MPRRDDNYHGGSGWRFSWRIDRLRKLHELGRAFGLTEDSPRDGGSPDGECEEHERDRDKQPPG